MTQLARPYLRASTKEQDAERAKEEVKAFADKQGYKIASWYIENVSGAAATRPELDRLINEAHEGDVLLVEATDRLTRLPAKMWDSLKQRIKDAGLQLVIISQPMTHQLPDSRMAQLITELLIDISAEAAREDYDTRRRRAQQGRERSGNKGGRPVQTDKYNSLYPMFDAKMSLNQIVAASGHSRSTVIRAKNEWRQQQADVD